MKLHAKGGSPTRAWEGKTNWYKVQVFAPYDAQGFWTYTISKSNGLGYHIGIDNNQARSLEGVIEMINKTFESISREALEAKVEMPSG